MKLGKAIARHGDLLIREIDELPEGVQKIEGNVLAYGEATGHSHNIEGDAEVFDNGNGQKLFIVKSGKAVLTHQEHKPITIKRGKYAVINEREYNGFEQNIRQVMD